MKLHLLNHRRMTQDGTYSVQEISEEQFIGTLQWGESQGIIKNHVSPRSSALDDVAKSVGSIPSYERSYTLENGDYLLIAERGKYYNGTFIDQCPHG